MAFTDFKNKVPIAHVGLEAVARSYDYELDVLTGKLHDANHGIRAIVLTFMGEIATDVAEVDYIIDVFASKITNIILNKGGESVWDASLMSLAILQAQRNASLQDFSGEFTASATRYFRLGVRIPMLDERFCEAMDDGLVPAKALDDATFSVATGADGNYPFTSVTMLIEAETYGLHELRRNYCIERITDKHTKSAADFKLPGGRNYHSLSLIRPPRRAANGYSANDFFNAIFVVDGDNKFVDHMTGGQLQHIFRQTNPYFDDQAADFVAADKLTNHMQNLFQPILWPARDSFSTGEKLSKAYPCFFNQLILNVAPTGDSPALPYKTLVTYLPVESDNDLRAKAGQLGLAGRTARPRTKSKKPYVDRFGARLLPAKVK